MTPLLQYQLTAPRYKGPQSTILNCICRRLNLTQQTQSLPLPIKSLRHSKEGMQTWGKVKQKSHLGFSWKVIGTESFPILILYLMCLLLLPFVPSKTKPEKVDRIEINLVLLYFTYLVGGS